jgi:hypothetical protein
MDVMDHRDARYESDTAALPQAAFYCVSDASYFLGAVAMVNSLRVLGHSEPIYVLDCGLTEAQRDHLSGGATIVPASDDSPPFLHKTAAMRAHPAKVMVLIDADIIVTRPLGGLIERASDDRVVAVADRLDRFVPEWGDLLGLGPAHPRQYISSSLVFLGGEFGWNVVQLMDEAQHRIELEGAAYSRALEPTRSGKSAIRGFNLDAGTFDASVLDHPWCFADQDVLNAVLSIEATLEQVEALDVRLVATAPFTGVRVVDEETLRCAYDDGTEPYALHHLFPVKPWLEPAIPGVYSQLLMRLVHGRDVAVRVPNRELPPHMRSGLLSTARKLRRGGLSARLRAVRDRFRGDPPQRTNSWAKD